MFRTQLVEEIKIHFVLSDFFFQKKLPFMTMWNNTIEKGRPQMTI